MCHLLELRALRTVVLEVVLHMLEVEKDVRHAVCYSSMEGMLEAGGCDVGGCTPCAGLYAGSRGG